MNFSIDFKALSIGEIIARGTYGDVFKAKWINRDVAVKKLWTNYSHETELNHLSRANHENIIFLYGVAMSDDTAYLVMEYVDGGSLHNIIHDKQPVYGISHVINWALQTAQATAYLHAKEPRAVIHRNLKPRCILLNDSYRCVKISDFSQATYLSPLMTAVGTLAYMAPEVFSDEQYTEKCDIYSFAIILWELLSQKVPYKMLTTAELIMYKVTQGERPSLAELKLNCPDNVIELMTNCWKENPNERCSMQEVISVLSNYPIDFEQLSL